MNNQINIAEILIVNGAGVFCLLYLAGTRLSNKLGKRVGEYLFNCMIAISIVALLLEMLSFCIDGIPGKTVCVAQYVSNTMLFPATTLMGYLWCLFVEFKISHNVKRIRRTAWMLVLPVVVAYALTVLNCLCKTGLLFSISSDNVYTRGRFWII